MKPPILASLFVAGHCILAACSSEKAVTFEAVQRMARSNSLIFAASTVKGTNYIGLQESDIPAVAIIGAAAIGGLRADHWGKQTMVFFEKETTEIHVQNAISQLGRDDGSTGQWLYALKPSRVFVLEPISESQNMQLRTITAQYIWLVPKRD